MVIEEARDFFFKGLTPNKTWNSLNDIEKQAAKNAISKKLSNRNKSLFISLTSESEILFKVSRDIALHVGLETKYGSNTVVSKIIGGILKTLKDTQPESIVDAVSKNFHFASNTNAIARLKGQSKSFSKVWDFTATSLFSWMKNQTFDSVFINEIEVKLNYLRKDEVGLMVLRLFFDSELILNYLNKSEVAKFDTPAEISNTQGYSNLKAQMATIETINPAVVNICNKLKSYMGDIDLFNAGAPTYYSILATSLSAYFAQAEVQGQSSAYLIFCEYIANQLMQLCCTEIKCKESTWDWTKESLNEWVSRNNSEKFITTNTIGLETDRKMHLIFNLLVFNRVDMSIWGVPAAGKRFATFWGDAL